MRVRVRALTGQTTVLDDLAGSDSINVIKLRINHLLNIPPILQRIIFSGKELADNLTIDEAGVKDDGVVHLVVRAPVEIARPTTHPSVSAGFTPIEHQTDPRSENAQHRGAAGFQGASLRASADGVGIDLIGAAGEPPSRYNERHEVWVTDPQVATALKQCRLVKVFIFLDLMFILISGMSGTHPLLNLAALLPLAGYYGVKSLDQLLVAVYFVFLLGAGVFRFVLLGVAIRYRYNIFVVIFLALGFFFECAIVWFVGRFWWLVRRLSVVQRHQIVEMQTIVPTWSVLMD